MNNQDRSAITAHQYIKKELEKKDYYLRSFLPDVDNKVFVSKFNERSGKDEYFILEVKFETNSYLSIKNRTPIKNFKNVGPIDCIMVMQNTEKGECRGIAIGYLGKLEVMVIFDGNKEVIGEIYPVGNLGPSYPLGFEWGRYVVVTDGKSCGVVDTADGKIVVPLLYEFIKPIGTLYAILSEEEFGLRWGVMDANFEWLIHPVFEAEIKKSEKGDYRSEIFGQTVFLRMDSDKVEIFDKDGQPCTISGGKLIKENEPKLNIPTGESESERSSREFRDNILANERNRRAEEAKLNGNNNPTTV